ncbi:hypothetical protein COY16_05455 [Candidatus Roizmanbacteria bacterium CG_4_10_14_0_2_um_filter_39_13]|uniref:Peptidase S74 domain-containing protein n=1 Tax=Candidatus Roizmanbacteria bacterium CG_4_10_14_0_2_um_filter_39_13 TaxID=1974825 RepID=A0A2M7TW03_9BACT|nr:MAG: hypothetical protein COY16_05455 [Candidatus Roizmanbacteria bacterium CG_4_10_14_0_2_um_filter_39_13]
MKSTKKYLKPKITSKRISSKLSSNHKAEYSAIEDLLISDVYAATIYIPLIFSDQNMKYNISSVENVLDTLASIDAFRFSYRNINDSQTIGVMAQDVQKTYPELVKKVSGTPYLGVNYAGLTALLLEAVKELQVQNKELMKRLTILEK